MKDYSKGKIYKLVSPSGLIYIGSTCEATLARRKTKHKTCYNEWKVGKFSFIYSFKVFEEDENNVDIVLVEAYPCNSKDELHSRERYWIENTKCVNKAIPTRTRKEYIEANSEKWKEWYKNYRQENKEKIQRYQVENADSIRENKRRYQERNKDKLNEKSRLNYEKNKLIIQARASVKVKCECGREVRKDSLLKHQKSKLHLGIITKV